MLVVATICRIRREHHGEGQKQCHGQAYAPQPKALADMQVLQQHFELVLPLSLGARGGNADRDERLLTTGYMQ